MRFYILHYNHVEMWMQPVFFTSFSKNICIYVYMCIRIYAYMHKTPIKPDITTFLKTEYMYIFIYAYMHIFFLLQKKFFKLKKDHQNDALSP